jgi:hypothetical protein
MKYKGKKGKTIMVSKMPSHEIQIQHHKDRNKRKEEKKKKKIQTQNRPGRNQKFRKEKY